MILSAIIVIAFSYLIGSISFAVLFSRLFINGDIRERGSGNAGTTNMMREGGFLPGALTFLCDALKGFIACYAGRLVFLHFVQSSPTVWAVYGAYICGVACMLGHIYPVFFGFKGGKGIATSVGIFAVCCPLAIVIGLVVFALTVIIFRYVSVGSVVSAMVVVVFSIVFYDKDAMLLPQAVLSAVMGLIVILKHTENIKRLINGTENKVGSGGKR